MGGGPLSLGGTCCQSLPTTHRQGPHFTAVPTEPREKTGLTQGHPARKRWTPGPQSLGIVRRAAKGHSSALGAGSSDRPLVSADKARRLWSQSPSTKWSPAVLLKKAKSPTPSPSPARNSDQEGGGKKKKKKKDKKHKKHKKKKAVAAAAAAAVTPVAIASPTTTSAQEETEAEPEPQKETESEVEDNLDDLEKHLRGKALRSMRKAQVSPQS
ncbi:serine/arginine repetitive matrix protein 1-like isoform X1 [Diceros bicornis minor]|uniref:serine/arginine repetitive matrix protein 1-like isoform X1 n=1 Tax=Diceros bicornis minor TaxID=77932 RepID=UPI0026EE24C1|nr:serine/arginine repetitive matrix protein 1-like isoform X1 [Diceros bicornis minor]